MASKLRNAGKVTELGDGNIMTSSEARRLQEWEHHKPLAASNCSGEIAVAARSRLSTQTTHGGDNHLTLAIHFFLQCLVDVARLTPTTLGLASLADDLSLFRHR